MSIDREIAEIRLALRNLHELLHKVAFQMENATVTVDSELSAFDQTVNNVAKEVSHIKDNGFTVTGLFPKNSTYISALLVLDGIIWVLAFALLYKIVQRVRQRQMHSQRWQERYRSVAMSFKRFPPRSGRPVVIADDLESNQVLILLDDYRPYKKSTLRHPPPSYSNEDEAESLLREIPPENRQQWTSID